MTTRRPFLRVIFDLSFCLHVFLFWGFIRGQRPFIVLFVIPEIFYRESTFLLFLLIFKYCGPRLKNCRGDGLEETSPHPLPASSLNRHREH